MSTYQDMANELKEMLVSGLDGKIVPTDVASVIERVTEEFAMRDPVDIDLRRYELEKEAAEKRYDENYALALAEAKEKLRRIMAWDVNEISDDLWQDFLDNLDKDEFIANMRAFDGLEWSESNLRTFRKVAVDWVKYEADKEYEVVLQEDL